MLMTPALLHESMVGEKVKPVRIEACSFLQTVSLRLRWLPGKGSSGAGTVVRDLGLNPMFVLTSSGTLDK